MVEPIGSQIDWRRLLTVAVGRSQGRSQGIQAGQGPLRGSHGGGGYLPNNAWGSGIQHRWVVISVVGGY